MGWFKKKKNVSAPSRLLSVTDVPNEELERESAEIDRIDALTGHRAVIPVSEVDAAAIRKLSAELAESGAIGKPGYARAGFDPTSAGKRSMGDILEELAKAGNAAEDESNFHNKATGDATKNIVSKMGERQDTNYNPEDDLYNFKD